MTYLNISLKLLLGFIGLLIVMRLLGKKELSEVTPFDIIYSVVFGGILEESLYDNKISVAHMLFGVFLWGLIIYIVELVSVKYELLRKLLKGVPAILIDDGKIDDRLLRKNKIEMEQLRSLLRIQNIFSLREVKYLTLEPGGQISIQKYDEYETPSKKDLNLPLSTPSVTYLLINKGKINKKDLVTLNKDEGWVKKLICVKGYTNIEDIIYAEWSEADGIFIIPYNKK